MRAATFAEMAVLAKYGFSKREETEWIENNNSRNLKVLEQIRRGWRFKSFHSTILNEHQVAELSQSIKDFLSQKYDSVKSQFDDSFPHASLVINGKILHTPPMLFGNDVLILSFGNVDISIDPRHSIYCWAAQVFHIFVVVDSCLIAC
jgi:hypothetical protein